MFHGYVQETCRVYIHCDEEVMKLVTQLQPHVIERSIEIETSDGQPPPHPGPLCLAKMMVAMTSSTVAYSKGRLKTFIF